MGKALSSTSSSGTAEEIQPKEQYVCSERAAVLDFENNGHYCVECGEEGIDDNYIEGVKKNAYFFDRHTEFCSLIQFAYQLRRGSGRATFYKLNCEGGMNKKNEHLNRLHFADDIVSRLIKQEALKAQWHARHQFVGRCVDLDEVDSLRLREEVNMSHSFQLKIAHWL